MEVERPAGEAPSVEPSPLELSLVERLLLDTTQSETRPPEELGRAAQPRSSESRGGASDIVVIKTLPKAARPVADLPELASLPPASMLGLEPILVEPHQVKIGLLVPLSGRGRAEGEALLAAAQLALFDVGGDTLVLIPKDTGGTPQGAAAAARAALAEGVRLILGPLFRDSVAAVAPMARAWGINVVAFSTDPSVAGDGVFLLGYTSGQQVERLIAFARARGLSRFAALAPDDDYGRVVVEQLRSSVEMVGGELTRVAFYGADAADAAEVVRDIADYDRRHAMLIEQRRVLEARADETAKRALARLKNLDTLGDVPYDALLLPDFGARLRQVAPLLPYYDIDPAKVRLLGTGAWDDASALTEPTLAGAWFVSPPPPARAGFVQRFTSVYGREPRRFSIVAYDATALAAALALAPSGTDFRAASLLNPGGFYGADGIFRFHPNGLAERGLAVLKILPGGAVEVLSPAPESFITQP